MELTGRLLIPSATGQSFADSGGAQAIAAPSLVEFFNNALWFSGDEAFPTKVAVSVAKDPSDFATTAAFCTCRTTF